MKPYRCGLVVGKFCPLHLGHELLLAQANQACDALRILSYTTPGYEGYGPSRRQAWLQARFPEARILVLDEDRLAAQCAQAGVPTRAIPVDIADADTHRRFVAWLCRDVLRETVDAVFTSEDYGDGFAQVLAAHFGSPVAHVCVDMSRQTVPVSGTQVRADLYANRNFLSQEVYADLLPRICVLGGESSGKTTLAAALAEALQTVWVPESGREIWELRAGRLHFDDMLLIAKTQVAREIQLALVANRVLVCDTSPLTTSFYSQKLFEQVHPDLHRLTARHYDLTLLCAPDFEFVQDGTRQNNTFRLEQHRWYVTNLQARGIEYTEVFGGPDERLESVLDFVAKRPF